MNDDMEYFVKTFIPDVFADLYNVDSTMSSYYFNHGGCYELAKIVKHCCPDSKIVIRDDNCHCAILFNDTLYDVNGIVNNKDKYGNATDEDIEYMKDRFGNDTKICGISVSNYIINYLKECRIEQMISDINSIGDNRETNGSFRH